MEKVTPFPTAAAKLSNLPLLTPVGALCATGITEHLLR
jgi:hypothetical protein